MSKFSGMSRTQCPIDCKPARCVITEIACCAHPCMGGVQQALQSKADVIERYAHACKALGIDAKAVAA